MSREDFKKPILMGKLKTRYQLVYFDLNTLHNIARAASYYCYCNNRDKFKICNIPIIFTNFEKDTEKKILIQFFTWYYNKLCNKLVQLFDQKTDCVRVSG